MKNNCKIDFLSSACEKVARTPTFPTQNMAYELCLTREIIHNYSLYNTWLYCSTKANLVTNNYSYIHNTQTAQPRTQGLPARFFNMAMPPPSIRG